MIKQIPIFSEEGGVGFDELMIVNKINEIIGFCNSLPQTEEGVCYGKTTCPYKNGVHPPHDFPQEKLDVIPSPRIDWCVDCKEEHGYNCPRDINVVALLEEYAGCVVDIGQAPVGAGTKRFHERKQEIISLFKSLQKE